MFLRELDEHRAAYAFDMNLYVKEFVQELHIALAPPVVTSSKGLARRFLILQRDHFRCQLCGASAVDGVRLEVDHIHPRAKGGSDDPANLWTLCFDCNRGKRDRLL